MATIEKSTQQLINRYGPINGECLPCLELLKRIDEDLALLDQEVARVRRFRWTVVGLLSLLMLTAGTGWMLYFGQF